LFDLIKTILKYLGIVFIVFWLTIMIVRADVTSTSTSVDVVQQDTPQQGDVTTTTTTTTSTTTTTTVPGYNQNVVSEQTTQTGDVLTNSTFGTGSSYSDDGWTITGYDASHNFHSGAGGNDPGGSFASGKDSKLEQSISVKDDAELSQAEINNGFSSKLSADIWYWNNYTNTTTMTQTITGASGNVTTQERIISGKNASNTGNVYVNYSDTYINTGNTETDYTIKVSVTNNNAITGNHTGPDIDDIELDIGYNEVTVEWVDAVTTSNTVVTESVSTAIVYCWQQTPSTCPDEGVSDTIDDIYDDLGTVADMIEDEIEGEDMYVAEEMDYFEEEIQTDFYEEFYMEDDIVLDESFETTTIEDDIDDMFAGAFEGMEDMFELFESDEDMVDVPAYTEESMGDMEFEEPEVMEVFEELETEMYEEVDSGMEVETEIEMDMDDESSTMTFTNVGGDEPEEIVTEDSVGESEELIAESPEEISDEPVMEEKSTTQTFMSVTKEEEVVEEEPAAEDELIAEADEVTEEMPTETTEEAVEETPIAKTDDVEEEVDTPTEEKEEKSTIVSKEESDDEEEDEPKEKKSDVKSKVKVKDKKTKVAEEKKSKKIELKVDIDKIAQKIEEKIKRIDKQLEAVNHIVSAVMIKNQVDIGKEYGDVNANLFDNRQLYDNRKPIYQDDNLMLDTYNFGIYENENKVIALITANDPVLKYQTDLNNAINIRKQKERELYILQTKKR